MSSQQNLVQAKGEKDFYQKGRDWEADRQARLEKSERRAWIVAGAATLIAAVAVVGIMSMAPFKRVVPYVFAVDQATGNVEMVNAADDRGIVGYSELLDKHWAQRYIVARESYSYKLLQSDYDTVMALSSEEVGRDYAKLYEGPNARDRRYGSAIEMQVKVLSITLTKDGVGTKGVVRFEKTVRQLAAEKSDPPQYFIATFAYEYRPSMFGKEKELIQNPTGYRVTSYRTDAEIAPVADAATAER